jgi:arabinan endo-1,5-alpha-L-arabinosidase
MVAATTAVTLRPPIQPAIPHDFPDPAVLAVGGTYYAYSTASHYGTRIFHVPVESSTSLTSGWSRARDAMPTLPTWVPDTAAGDASVWAPEVTARSDDSYRLYFTAHSASQNAQCVGVARSSSPEGPFHAVSPEPLICRPEDADAIDPKPFTDTDGKHYLLYSSSHGGNATIWLQQINADGTKTIGHRRAMIRSDRLDEAHVLEAPSLIRHRENYVLFYSGNGYNSGNYFINYATAPSLCGSFIKHNGQFLNQHTLADAYKDPGGQDVLHDHHHDFLLFHAYTTPTQRAMFVAGLHWDDGNPILKLGNTERTDMEPQE